MIRDDALLYRRVRDDSVNVVKTDDGDMPSSVVFEPDDDGLSLFLLSLLEANGLTARDTIRGMAGYRVFELRASVLYAAGLTLRIDTDPPNAIPHIANCAHVLGEYPPLSKKAQHRAQQNVRNGGRWLAS